MNLTTSLRDSIFRPMADPMMDIGEVLLDTVFEDGILKDIPIIGTIAGVAKASVAVRERQLAKNTYAFIRGIREQTISKEKLEEYRNKLDDPKRADKELGYVLLLLDREIHAEKSAILGRMYAAIVNQSIRWEQFQELSEALDRMFMADFPVLERMRYGTPLMTGIREGEVQGLQRLESLGLVAEGSQFEVRGKTLGELAFGDRMTITPFGKLMMEFVNNEQ